MDYTIIKQKYQEVEDQIKSDIVKTSVPMTLKALTRYVDKIDLILNSLNHLKDNFYCSQILTRSLFEHYIVGYYIFTKWRNERNDNVGMDYYREYFLSEFVKQKNYNFAIDNIENKSTEILTIENVRSYGEGWQEATQKDLEELHQKGNQFEVKKIGKYLISLDAKSEGLKGVHKGMIDFLRRYNKLSSWVHGGPTADVTSFEKEMHLDSEICRENIAWSEIASKDLKFSIVSIMFVEVGEEYLPTLISMKESKSAN